MQSQLYPKWGSVHTKKVKEFEKQEKSVSKKATDLGKFVMWLHEDT